MRLILASKSPRRKKLLKQLGLEFEVIPSGADESGIKENDPKELVKVLARLKADTVARTVEDAVVIGSDTLVYHNGEMVGKPQGVTESDKLVDAEKTLRKLSGGWHQVFTGVCIINTNTGQILEEAVESKAKFRELTDEDILRCLENRLVLEVSGSHTGEIHPRVLEAVIGSYTNIEGLPTERVIPMLREVGVDV